MKNNFKKAIYLLIIAFPFVLEGQNTHTIIDTSKVYQLGEVEVYAKKDQEQIKSKDIEKLNKYDVANSLNALPSIVLANAGSRNESTIFLRGFDIRSVPIYQDGIPVYVPFDGYVDLARFTVADLSKIEVSKGYSSILYGANTLGGAINLVSSKPIGKVDLKVKAGIMSGNGYNTNISLGNNFGKFYTQLNVSRLKREFIPLSKDFDTLNLQNDFSLDNSYRMDDKISVKVGFTPNSNSEYSLNYIYQHGEKGNPVYLGSDPNQRVRYWQWPFWDKRSLYFISKNKIGANTVVKSRLFYDKFINQLKAYDNNSYDTQNMRYAFTSNYNDDSYGASVEMSNTDIKNNNLKFAIHFKRDNHRENNEGDPVTTMADNTISIGIEDIIELGENFKMIPGVSFNQRKSIIAEYIDQNTGNINQFKDNNNSAYNAQIANYYQINSNSSISYTAAYKTRFATMKDRYAFRLGTAIPNPDLEAETAFHNELAYNFRNKNIYFSSEIFYSRLNNTIQSVDNVQPGITQMQNTGEAEFFGLDLSLNYKIIEGLNFNTSYSFIRRFNLSHPDIKFTDVPEHKIYSYIDYNAFDKLQFTLAGEFNTSRYSTSYGVKSAAFAVFNFRTAYSVTKNIEIEAGVNNFLDRNYSLIEGYPAEGINYYLALSFDLSK